MSAGGEVGRLRRAVGLCSRGAVAWKAAYMQTLEQGTEQRLLARCADRYALLERLIGLLVERGVGPEEVRGLLDDVDPDPGRYARLEAALADARLADARLASLIEDSLTGAALPAAVEACFEDALTGLAGPAPERAPPALAASGAVLAPRGGAAGPPRG